MTRKKKSRSLKRIHSVKTGNPSKLKRDGDTDRQSSNLKAKNKPKSVYQKFLDENPDAVEKQQQPKVAAQEKATTQDKEATKSKNAPFKKSSKKEADKTTRKTEQDKDIAKERTEREPDLLSQLDNKNFNDFY